MKNRQLRHTHRPGRLAAIKVERFIKSAFKCDLTQRSHRVHENYTDCAILYARYKYECVE